MDNDRSAVNPLPPVVAALFLVIIGIEIVLQLGERGIIGGAGAVGWRLAAIQSHAFSGAVLDWMVANNHWPPAQLARFVTYPFVHASFTHALFAGVILLAMGKMVGEAFGQIATLAIFVVSGIGGALAYALILDDPQPLIGGFPPVYGLIGAFTWLLARSLARIGANQSRAFTLIAVLMGIQLLFGVFFETQNDWVADLGGFAAGFGLCFVVSPAGWARLRGRGRGRGRGE
ncbi:rhomboid family intramembrane serine protease [Pontibaca methylaminivorans]|uniref:Rhomboid family protein n=1 Tax=Pontibaca methylaminivorans TaxID=515897 RepID=A0A1R3WXC3_9RHOB|nr:rhomboid family intramembrane serine protease [Pontibaca methylaminivorans]SIT82897.1 Rhomboid family protein [Pontibaca methylaminivorans]